MRGEAGGTARARVGQDTTYAARNAKGALIVASQSLESTYYDLELAREHAASALAGVNDAADHLFRMLEAAGVDISPLAIEDFGDPHTVNSVAGGHHQK